ncbi:hypothetical protein Tco_0919618 [Tanacetum coccineum]
MALGEQKVTLRFQVKASKGGEGLLLVTPQGCISKGFLTTGRYLKKVFDFVKVISQRLSIFFGFLVIDFEGLTKVSLVSFQIFYGISMKKKEPGTKFDIKKFDGNNDFTLWEVRMKALLEQHGLAAALKELPAAIIAAYDNVIQKKAFSTLILCLGDRVLREITKETTTTGIWKKLETLYMTKSLANRLYLKKKLYTFHMHLGKIQYEHIDKFHKLVCDLAAIDTAISVEDQALLLLTSLPSSYDNFVETLLYGRDTLKLDDVLATLNSRKLQKMTKAKDDGGEGLYMRGIFGQRDMKHGTDSAWSKSQGRSSKLMCYICHFEEHLKRDCPRYNHKKSQGFVRNKDHVSGSGANEYDSADVMMAMSVEKPLDWIMDSGGSYHITYMRDYLVDFEEYDGGNVLLGDGRECRVRGTGTLRSSIQQCTKSGVAKYLGVAGIQQQNGLVKETNVTLLAQGFFGWLASIKQGMLEPVKVKCIFLRYRKGIVGKKLWRYNSVQVLQGVEIEVELQEDHTFEVEPHGNVDHVAVACEVISKCNTGLKDDMDARSDVYVLSNGCKKCSDDSDVYYWEYTPGMFMHLFLYIDDMVFLADARLRSRLPRVCWIKQREMYLGHSILSLEGSLSGDCDVKENGKWSCIYAVGSQVYQGVCTRPDMALVDVGMLDGFDHELQIHVQGCAGSMEAIMLHMMAFLTTKAEYMTLTEAARETV